MRFVAKATAFFWIMAFAGNLFGKEVLVKEVAVSLYNKPVTGYRLRLDRNSQHVSNQILKHVGKSGDFNPFEYEQTIIYENILYDPVSSTKEISLYYLIRNIDDKFTELTLVGMYDYRRSLNQREFPVLSQRLLADLAALVRRITGDRIRVDDQLYDDQTLKRIAEEETDPMVEVSVAEDTDEASLSLSKDPFAEGGDSPEQDSLIAQLKRQIRVLESREQRLATQTRDLQSELERLRQALAKSGNAATLALHDSVEVLKAKVRRLERQQLAPDDISFSSEDGAEQYTKLQNDLALREVEIKKLNSELDSLAGAMMSENEQRMELLRKQEELERSLAEARQESARLAGETEALQASLQEAEARLREVADVEANLAAGKEQIASLQSEKEALEARLSDAETKQKALSDENAQMGRDLTAAKVQREKLESDITSLEAQIERLSQTDSDASAAEAARLRKKLDGQKLKLSRLEKRNDSLEQSLDRYIAGFGALRKQVESARAETDEVRGERDDLQARIRELERSLAAKDDAEMRRELSTLRARNDSLNERIRRSDEENLRMSDYLGKLEQNLTEARKEKAELSREIESLRSQIANASAGTDNGALAVENEKLQQEVAALRLRSDSLEREIASLSTVEKGLRKQLIDSQNDLEAEREKRKAQEDKVASLEEQLAATEPGSDAELVLRKQIETLKASNDSLSERIDRSDKENVRLSEYLEQVEGQLSSSRLERTKLNKEVETLRDQLARATDTDNSELTAENKALLAEIEDLKLRNDSLDRGIASLSTVEKGLRKQLNDSQNELEEERKKRKAQENKIASLEEQLAATEPGSDAELVLRKQIETLKASNDSLSERIDRSDKENARLSEYLEQVEGQLSSSRLERNKLNKEVETLRDRLARATNTDNSELTAENKALHAELDALKLRNDSLNRAISKSDSDRDVMKKRIADLEKERNSERSLREAQQIKVAELQRRLDAADSGSDEAAGLRIEIEGLEASNDSLSKRIERADAENLRMSNYLSELERNLTESRKTQSGLEKDIADLRDQIARSENVDFDAMASKNKELLAEIDALKLSHSQLSHQRDSLDRSIVSLEAKSKEMGKALSDTEGELKASRSSLREKDSEIEDLKNKLTAAEAAADPVSEANRAMEQRIVVLRDSISYMETANDSLRKLAARRADPEENVRLRQEVATLQERVEGLETENEKITQQMEAARTGDESEIQGLQRELAQVRERARNLEIQQNTLAQDRDMASRQLAAEKDKVRDLSLETDQLGKEVKELRTEQGRLAAELKATSQQAEEALAARGALSERLEEVTAERNRLNRAINGFQNELDALKEDNSSLQRLLTAAQAGKSETAQIMDSLIALVDSLYKVTDSEDAQMVFIREQRTRLEKIKKSLDSRAAKLRDQEKLLNRREENINQREAELVSKEAKYKELLDRENWIRVREAQLGKGTGDAPPPPPEENAIELQARPDIASEEGKYVPVFYMQAPMGIQSARQKVTSSMQARGFTFAEQFPDLLYRSVKLREVSGETLELKFRFEAKGSSTVIRLFVKEKNGEYLNGAEEPALNRKVSDFVETLLN